MEFVQTARTKTLSHQERQRGNGRLNHPDRETRKRNSPQRQISMPPRQRGAEVHAEGNTKMAAKYKVTIDPEADACEVVLVQFDLVKRPDFMYKEEVEA